MFLSLLFKSLRLLKTSLLHRLFRIPLVARHDIKKFCHFFGKTFILRRTRLFPPFCALSTHITHYLIEFSLHFWQLFSSKPRKFTSSSSLASRTLLPPSFSSQRLEGLSLIPLHCFFEENVRERKKKKSWNQRNLQGQISIALCAKNNFFPRKPFVESKKKCVRVLG